MKKKIKLFCLPYAGGSARMYAEWRYKLAENIELCPIELAGRGRRIAESYYANIDEAVDDIYNLIADDISKFDYAIFGHSMGALLTYELTQKIMSLGLRKPIHIFFSGRTPPGTLRTHKPYALMSPSEFQEKILALGGTPPELFQHPELREVFIPLLRSDFAIAETEVERPKVIPLTSNISILLGETEGISPVLAAKWELHTLKKCSVHYIKGGHFFLLDEKEAVINIINTNLLQLSLNTINQT